MSYKEFLDSTPRMLMGQDTLNRRYEENILLSALSKIYGSMGSSNSGSTEKVEYAESLSDLF